MDELAPDTPVMFIGLAHHPELNGTTGKILKRIAPGEPLIVGRGPGLYVAIAGDHYYSCWVDQRHANGYVHRRHLVPLRPPRSAEATIARTSTPQEIDA